MGGSKEATVICNLGWKKITSCCKQWVFSIKTKTKKLGFILNSNSNLGYGVLNGDIKVIEISA